MGFGETGFCKTGFGETGFGETGFGETGFGETGFGETGFGETGFGETGGHPCTASMFPKLPRFLSVQHLNAKMIKFNNKNLIQIILKTDFLQQMGNIIILIF